METTEFRVIGLRELSTDFMVSPPLTPDHPQARLNVIEAIGWTAAEDQEEPCSSVFGNVEKFECNRETTGAPYHLEDVRAAIVAAGLTAMVVTDGTLRDGIIEIPSKLV